MANQKSVLCAMSGGVDSSAVARILLDQGFRVAGVTMVLNCDARDTHICSENDLLEAFPEARDARRVCEVLGIEHYILDLREEFARFVIRPFCRSYRSGATPNPCIECNKHLKFGALQEFRKDNGFDYLATGHYANIIHNEPLDRYELHQAFDLSKDQSYVLYHLSQDDLAHVLFPLGGFSKSMTRTIASDAGFPNAQKSESQDICFVPDGDYASFIESYDHFVPERGPIVDLSGKVLGEHKGLLYYTIGQRKGLGIAVGEPLFVLSKDIKHNTLVVGRAADAGVRELGAVDVTFPSDDTFTVPRTVLAKVNYRAKKRSARAWFDGKQLSVRFFEPVRAIAPGQSVVLYEDDRVLAGGTIVSFK